MHTWQDEFDAKLLALDFNFMPPKTVYPSRIRRLYYGKYEPDLWLGNNDRCMLLAGYFDATNVLLNYLMDHYGWTTPYAYFETEPALWQDPGNSIDEKIETSAIVEVPAHEYSKPIEILVWPIAEMNQIRIWIPSATSPNITKVKLELHYAGEWLRWWDIVHEEWIYFQEQGILLDDWTIISSEAGTLYVDKYRLSFFNNSDAPENVYLAETDHKLQI